MALILLLLAFFSIPEGYAHGKLPFVTFYTMQPYNPKYNVFYREPLKNELADQGVNVTQITFREHPERETLLIEVSLDADCIRLPEVIRKVVTESVFVTSADVRCGRERYWVGEDYH
ncbi:hypothetical protein Y032_0008g99 [Ancylostoma ceylanicum]|uniref:Uncharacterized protein n=1 Tax=Ancylostoma ceylanicum TaxID=53326 RepID=A0A016VNH5_9BILA|nr:hypothetical protein Y032_0008g99 [Ancylostoma ceylanicum]